ncbi:hypothetical protein ABIA00_003219 [Bradyrhizobium ottawaense]
MRLLSVPRRILLDAGHSSSMAASPLANDNDRPVHVCSDHPWSALKPRAYEDIDAWVPQLGLESLKRYHTGYHAVASFRPSNSATVKKRGRALNIQPEGICDYADSNRGYSPTDLVGVCLGLQPHEAADWQKGCVGEPDDGTPLVDTSKLKPKADDNDPAPAASEPKPPAGLTDQPIQVGALWGSPAIQREGTLWASLAPTGGVVSVLWQGWSPKLVAHGRDSASLVRHEASSHVPSNLTGGARAVGTASGTQRCRVALALLATAGVASYEVDVRNTRGVS